MSPSTDPATKADLHAVKTDIDGRLNAMDGRFDKIDGRFDKIDGRVDKIDGRLDEIDGRLDKIDGRVDKIDGRLDKIGGRLVILERIESNVRLIAENMAAKPSTTEMKEADERLAGRVSLLEDVARQHSEDIRLLQEGSNKAASARV